MRISDWSSDVCSSDLRAADPQPRRALRSLQHDGDFRDEWGRRSGGADRTIGRSVQLEGGDALQADGERQPNCVLRDLLDATHNPAPRRERGSRAPARPGARADRGRGPEADDITAVERERRVAWRT